MSKQEKEGPDFSSFRIWKKRKKYIKGLDRVQLQFIRVQNVASDRDLRRVLRLCLAGRLRGPGQFLRRQPQHPEFHGAVL